MSLLERRIRGFRLVDVVALGVLVAMVLGVYLAKTVAGRERGDIARITRQIEAEQERIRLLHAEVAYLEQPSRIERLASAYLGLAPISAKREANPDDISRLAVEEAGH